MIRVQQQPFDPGHELSLVRQGRSTIGGTVMFLGTVRDLSDGKNVKAMTLEHYPGMTEKALAEIEAEAQRRWPLDATLIIHRYGRLEPGEDIVLVIAASAHREAAFAACHFLIDWLKTRAPFWKLEENDGGASWVAPKDSDDDAAKRWTE
ncbi:MAG: molybdenum cofactor biosynthesis protein MoaE [Aestuariivirga sp.]|uniref:molybdenum cofactor biosynthesis protein MoaE n=1 Tax=Aestuariivirga sp. TaxID=2650926 RepID=UPI0025BB29C9|nr:molybdenum cofactor biosynthesis protein MoaE [Aestuariivirga sp.]MCA3559620.1 molybdenum cofactor biosynthesis protein MoaE [Aestuariivirga sp.]